MAPTLDIYTDILEPWGSHLSGDPRIGGRDIRVLFSINEPEEIDIQMMPYVKYFLERNWIDDAVGSGSYSPQARRLVVRLGFLLAVANQDSGQLAKDLFLIGGDLIYIVRERRNFNATKSIVGGDKMVWDFDSIGVETIGQIGTQKISFTMELFANVN